MKKITSFIILAICLFLGAASGLYIAKTYQYSSEAKAYKAQETLHNQMENQLKTMHNSFIDLAKPDYYNPYLNSIINKTFVEMQESIAAKDSSSLDRLKKIIVLDYHQHQKLIKENKRLEKLLQYYENQRYRPCNVYTINFSNMLNEMHEAEKIKKEDLNKFRIPYSFTDKNKRDNYFISYRFLNKADLIIVQNWAEQRLLAYLIINEKAPPLQVLSSTMKGDDYCGIQSKVYENGLVEINTDDCEQGKKNLEYVNIEL